MTVREIIRNLQNELKKSREENESLRNELKSLTLEKNEIEKRLNSLEKVFNEAADEPVVEEVESQLTAVVANVDGETYADVVEGSGISIDDVVEEPKPKRSRRKKTEETPIFVEPVEEPENA